MKIDSTISLRDWTVTIDALGRGEQIFILRKGGIHEETRHFAVQNSQFFLFPAFEHEKSELVKPEYRHRVKDYADRVPQEIVELDYFADLIEDIELTDQEQVDCLFDYHIWTQDMPNSRLKWKRKQPLHLLILRVYKLQQQMRIPFLQEYGGCKSWIQLPEQLRGSVGESVLAEEEFAQRLDDIREAISQANSMLMA